MVYFEKVTVLQFIHVIYMVYFEKICAKKYTLDKSQVNRQVMKQVQTKSIKPA